MSLLLHKICSLIFLCIFKKFDSMEHKLGTKRLLQCSIFFCLKVLTDKGTLLGKHVASVSWKSKLPHVCIKTCKLWNVKFLVHSNSCHNLLSVLTGVINESIQNADYNDQNNVQSTCELWSRPAYSPPILTLIIYIWSYQSIFRMHYHVTYILSFLCKMKTKKAKQNKTKQNNNKIQTNKQNNFKIRWVPVHFLCFFMYVYLLCITVPYRDCHVQLTSIRVLGVEAFYNRLSFSSRCGAIQSKVLVFIRFT